MPRCFQILDESVAGLIHVLALAGHAAADVAVVVPVVVVDLDEAHAALDEPAGHEHAVGKGAGLLRIFAVELVGGSGSLLMSVSSGTLACMRKAISYCWMRVCVSGSPTAVIQFVQRVQAFDGALAHAVGHAGRVVDVENGIALAAEAHARVLAGQIAAGPEARGDGLLLLAIGRRGDEHDKGRQVLIHRAQAVRNPRTEAGTARDLVAGLHVSDGGLVIDRLGVQRAHEADVIGHLRRLGSSSCSSIMPHWPCRAKLYFDGAMGKRA
jgi:hypothetical protein